MNKLPYIHFILFSVMSSLFPLNCSSQESDNYSKDSLEIVKTLNDLRAKELDLNAERKDSIRSIIFANSKSKKSELEDLLEFSFARHVYTNGNIDEALKIVEKQIEVQPHNTFQLAKFYNLKGVILTLKKRYKSSVNAYLKAAKLYANSENYLRESIIFSNIANMYLALGDHQQAYYYATSCFKELRKYPDHKYFSSIAGVLAITENNLGYLDSAAVHIKMGKQIANKTNDLVGLTLLNYAQGELEYKKENFKKAIPYVHRSLSIAEKNGLKQYLLTGNTLLLNIYNDIGDYENAIIFGEGAEKYHKYSDNKSALYSIKIGLAKAFASVGNYKKAYDYRVFSDSVKSMERKSENRSYIDSLLIQFEFVETKNKLLLKESENKEQALKIQNQRWIVIFIISLLILIIFIGVMIFRFKQQQLDLVKNKQQKSILQAIREGEKKERVRVSSELHDGLSAELTALRIALENTEGINDQTLKLVKNAHLITRRISHNLSPLLLEEKGLVEAIRYFTELNQNDKNKIAFFTNIKNQLNLNVNDASILYRCTQEIIQNAIKHANAKFIHVQIVQEQNRITISVEDDGVGFDTKAKTDSIGLSSIKERINLIGGDFEIESQEKEGSTFFIHYYLK
ncbi:MAG: ATP-binding protein [Brumimicrobium sp.]